MKHTRNLHEIEHALFDARNSSEKYRCCELTRTSFSYVCYGLYVVPLKCHRHCGHINRSCYITLRR